MRDAAQVEPFTAAGVALAFVGVVVADVLDGVSHHLLVVHVGPGRDLSTEQHHAGLTHRFCSKKYTYITIILGLFTVLNLKDLLLQFRLAEKLQHHQHLIAVVRKCTRSAS